MKLHLNADKIAIVEEIFKIMSVKKGKFMTRKEIWKTISDYEMLIQSHVCSAHNNEYQLYIPSLGYFGKVIDKTKSKKPNQNAKRNNYFRITFNEIFLSTNI